MSAKEVTGSKVAAPLFSFLILFLLLSTTALAVGLYTRTDELSCGDAKVQAVTTCTGDSYGAFSAWCTEQHLLFLDRTTGNTVTVKPGHPFVYRDSEGKRKPSWIDKVAGDWACLSGKEGSYVVIRYMHGMYYYSWTRYEVFDTRGRQILSDKGAEDGSEKEDRIRRDFDRSWRSLGLPYPCPWDSFITIQLFREDRK
jgi:hypothetical protein